MSILPKLMTWMLISHPPLIKPSKKLIGKQQKIKLRLKKQRDRDKRLKQQLNVSKRRLLKKQNRSV